MYQFKNQIEVSIASQTLTAADSAVRRNSKKCLRINYYTERIPGSSAPGMKGLSSRRLLCRRDFLSLSSLQRIWSSIARPVSISQVSPWYQAQGIHQMCFISFHQTTNHILIPKSYCSVQSGWDIMLASARKHKEGNCQVG